MNPKLVQWDYGKEINVTLTDALLSLESLRFMMGGAIRRPSSDQKVIIRHTEQVVCGENGVVPKPKDHLTGVELTPTATVGHPIRLINLTTGARTQITTNSASVSIDGEHAINFVNPSMLAGETNNTKKTAKGDQVRIFWEVEVANNSGAETAIEVTISPDTFPGTLIQSIGLLAGIKIMLINLVNCWNPKYLTFIA